MPFESCIVFVVVDEGLKSGVTADRFLTSSFDMVNIVVM